MNTTQQPIQDLLVLGLRMDLINGLLLGFLTCTLFMSLSFDYHLIKLLLTQQFNVFVFLNRLTYLTVRYIGRLYFIIAVLLTQIPKQLNCSVITRIHQIIFYVSLTANHWHFSLRTLATWRDHHRYPYVLAFALTGLFGLITGAAMDIWHGKIGSVIEPYGCIYLLYEPTLPSIGISSLLLSVGIFFHTTCMILAAMRLSSFSETIDGREEIPPSWTSFAAYLSVNVASIFRGQDRIGIQKHSGAVLAEVLIKQGFHQWIMHIFCLILFILVPVYAFRDNPTIVMAGVSIFTAADIELGCRIFRATSDAMRAPVINQTTNTSSSFFSSEPLKGRPTCQSTPIQETSQSHTSRNRTSTIDRPSSPSQFPHQSKNDEELALPSLCKCFESDCYHSHV